MDKLWNYVSGLLEMVNVVAQLRSDVKVFKRKTINATSTTKSCIARIRELTQRLEHSETLQDSETRAFKAELETALLRFERRLPPAS